MNADEDALLTLAHVVEPGDPRLGAVADDLGPRELIASIRDRALVHRDVDALAARLDAFDIDAARAAAAEIGVRVISRDSSEWPSQLDDLGPARPFVLWALGAPNLRLCALTSIAVVGARAATPYGEHVAREWSAHLSDAGWMIASGGAYGIDAAAHRGVLSAGGITVCVLATGVDVAYPSAHAELLARIADSGLVISETPLGSQARRQRFLTRNRILAALTRATVVVEAAMRSGTTSTANAAYGLNRPVLAVPGPVTSPMSAGCHHLIQEQIATIAGSWNEVLAMLGDGTVLPSAVDGDHGRPTDALSQLELRVLDSIPGRGRADLEALVMRSGVGSRQLITALGTLETLGFIVRTDSDWRLPRG